MRAEGEKTGRRSEREGGRRTRRQKSGRREKQTGWIGNGMGGRGENDRGVCSGSNGGVW